MDSLPRFVLDHFPDAVYAANTAGRLVFANRATCRLLQYHRDEIKSLSLWDIDVAFDAETWSTRWSLIKENKELRGESRLKRRDGTTIPVEVTRIWDLMTPTDGEAQEVLVVLARDVAYRTEEVDQAVQRLLRRRAHSTVAGPGRRILPDAGTGKVGIGDPWTTFVTINGLGRVARHSVVYIAKQSEFI